MLKDIADLADRYDVSVETAMRVRGAAADTIIKEAAKGAALVMLGASQRSGDELFFGETASAVVSGCTVPVILVAGERAGREDKKPEKDTAEAAKKEAERANGKEGASSKETTGKAEAKDREKVPASRKRATSRSEGKTPKANPKAG